MAVDYRQMRDKVTFQRPVYTSDGAGGSALSWQEVAQLFAHIDGSSVTESVREAQMQARRSYNITIRRNIAIKPDMRVIYNGLELHITSVLHDADRKHTNIKATEEVQ